MFPTKPYHTSSTSSTWSSSTSPAIRKCSSSSSPNKTVCFSRSRSSSPSGDRTTLRAPNSYPTISPRPSVISAPSWTEYLIPSMLGLLTYHNDARYVSILCVSGCAEGVFRAHCWGYIGSTLVVEDDFYLSFPARRPRRGDGFSVGLQPEVRAYECL